ncbi:1,2-phenylacetyl-CoA epoxidase subunit PaaC [Actinomycetospora sp. NBRC 106378]|uniref:1,2-phenylacetyl-CoA epoxidase subunit PaaC n=1 Tax=Actinomycetospora sp. NBRC 106378 TaxID=3032208 RepID=UPI0024A26816|nr:1,2-phenylacetyl-CoA epoxidase subunit PaaC [Actinomycetospora sp. NBRC 106378]GLZ56318.1 putative phenylacetic acid degradation protein PaaC/phenylacetate-CoA oxygenase, PaaI subunit [Actinomycetospora sp. NBRC 106378]
MNDHVFDGLADADQDGRWAYGAGFDETVVEVTAPAPDGVDRDDLAAYCLMLADDALVASQRLSEWATHAPELEEEVALANIALDLLGQARVLLSRAGHLGAAARFRTPTLAAGLSDEDVLAYFRDDRSFRNVTLAEMDLGDFGRTMAWILVYSSWRLALMTTLRGSADPVLAAVAAKAVPELAYQREYAAGWVVRLGDGTDESHRRMQAGLDDVWPFVTELFLAHPVETRLVEAGVAVDPASLRGTVDADLAQVLPVATLTEPTRPAVGLVGGRGGRDGVHTEELGQVLAVMQSLARAHPDATW